MSEPKVTPISRTAGRRSRDATRELAKSIAQRATGQAIDADEMDAAATGGREPLNVRTGPEGIRALAAALDGQLLPDTYVSDGRLVVVEAVSGSLAVQHAGDDAGLPMVSTPLTAPHLARMLAEHAFIWQRKSRRGAGGESEYYVEEVTPATSTLTAALAGARWPGLPPLHGIIGAPTMRADGTLLQRPGYDGKTGFYLAPRVKLDAVPDRPSKAEVNAARRFILEQLLSDFPWVTDADRANYLAIMVTPLIRPFLRCLVPFAVVTATMPGSGKTILTAGMGLLVGQRVLTWTHSDEELRKSVTSVLSEPGGVVVFDNLHEGAVINSPVLARLITEPRWSDRGLGSNRVVTVPNDRLWLATGNSLSVGGDMASRTVLIRLDPNRPDPDRRSGFRIPHLDSWIIEPSNQRTVLRHLLVLILDWTAAGAPESADAPAMRQFTRWAQLLGGFLAHHRIPGFLSNLAAVREVDEDESEWLAFLTRWHDLHGRQKVTSRALIESTRMTGGSFGEPIRDPWEGMFPTDVRGNTLTSRALGNRLRGQIGRWRGHYVLRHARDSVTNMGVWWVEVKEQ